MIIIFLSTGYNALHLKSRVDFVLQCSIYGYSYDVNNDGDPSWIYSYYSNYNPNTSYPIMVGIDKDWSDEWSRGHIQWDISSIPDTNTIISVGIRLLVAYRSQWDDEWDNNGTWIEIRDMIQDQGYWTPSNGDYADYTLYNDAGNGNKYADSLFISMDPTYNVYYPSDTTFLLLNNLAVQDLQNALSRDWFGIGLHRIGEGGDGGSNPDVDEGVNFFGSASYLYVSTLPPDNIILSSPDVYPDTGYVNSEFSFTIHYYDGWGYEPCSVMCVIDDTIKLKLTLLSGYAYDGVYGKKITLLGEGLHRYYFWTINTNETVKYYPENAPAEQIEGPFLLPSGISENDIEKKGESIIFDITGRIMKCDIKELPNGIYFIKSKNNIRKINVIK
uniref:Uncharacterized protein n=1 Tax=candidate division WOR-3 bacterium TaxID=2052148 RepID=A0A7C4U7I2_UNCW3